MNRIVPISDLQTQAKKVVEQVKKTKEPVIITQRGRASAVLVDYEDYEGHLATQAEMSYPDWKQRLSRAQNESGKGISMESYLKKRKH
ncbi:MAG: type II toxin-antitoxin system Phd/YefM family antitoxin [Elusimicrobia bacterium]|nr:type II toxin-antitoxin system Phd/YefM family antitoxin [Elusimicrobiota bacterium]MBI4218454.1 type II toxin-antitoxin system Phd/YefM family antitoxin [Elusimicrobiota bacterium]